MLCAVRGSRRVLGPPGDFVCVFHCAGGCSVLVVLGRAMRWCCVVMGHGLQRGAGSLPSGLRVPDEELTQGFRWQTVS